MCFHCCILQVQHVMLYSIRFCQFKAAVCLIVSRISYYDIIYTLIVLHGSCYDPFTLHCKKTGKWFLPLMNKIMIPS